MTTHTTRSNVSKLEVISTGSRRRWTLEEKQRIIAESYSVPCNVSATARRYGLGASQLYIWRQKSREGRLSAPRDQPAFVPALIDPGHGHNGKHTGAAASMTGRMEIVLSAHGARLIVGRDVDAEALMRVINVLERA